MSTVSGSGISNDAGKQSLYGCQAYSYQLYGDPALPLLFGKIQHYEMKKVL